MNKLNDSLIDTTKAAYLIEVDGHRILLRMTPLYRHMFDWTPSTARDFTGWLPAAWRSFAVFDLTKRQWKCGAVRHDL